MINFTSISFSKIENRAGVQLRVSYILLFLHHPLFKLLHIMEITIIEQEQIKTFIWYSRLVAILSIIGHGESNLCDEGLVIICLAYCLVVAMVALLNINYIYYSEINYSKTSLFTILPVKLNFDLQLGFGFQSLFNLNDFLLIRPWSM